MPNQQPAKPLTPADSSRTPSEASTGSRTGTSADRAPSQQRAGSQVRRGTSSHERVARVGAVILLIITCVAVAWPSGRDVAELKDSLGPAFLSARSKDVVLNLVMLAPATFCAVVGWRDPPWWMWALVGCVIGLSAEVLQSLLPLLERRPSLANVGQNAVGAWAGALAARYLRERMRPRAGGVWS